ncbi:unnamed protein product [Cutaneotrichosporon oleaginosum]
MPRASSGALHIPRHHQLNSPLTHTHHAPLLEQPRSVATRVRPPRPLLHPGPQGRIPAPQRRARFPRPRHPLTPGAQIFGLTQATDAQAAFYPVVSARNVSLGLCILAFTLTGQRRALGTLLLCFTAMCGVDLAFVLRIHNVQRGKIAMHAVKLVLFPVMAAKMLEWI